ncbi:hypothetical protein FRC11_014980 [Ceratobasidium sp. 423]|nr:hypothetical protein FRC11_014980 [Ceratobasidium sp. 423]
MNSHTSGSRSSSSVDGTFSKRKSHADPPQFESKPPSQRLSTQRNSQSTSVRRRPQSTSTNSEVRSDGSWRAPEVLAWKRPQRTARVARATVVPERQPNRCNKFDAEHGDVTPHSQQRRACWEGSDLAGITRARSPSKSIDGTRDQSRKEVNTAASRRGHQKTPHDFHHQSLALAAPSTLDTNHGALGQQHQFNPRPRKDKLASLSKDFHSQVVKPMSNRFVHPGEEGMLPLLASKKVTRWMKTPRKRTERPRSASLTQALRFTALLAQVPLADAGLDEKIIPSRYNPQNRTAQGSRFMGC